MSIKKDNEGEKRWDHLLSRIASLQEREDSEIHSENLMTNFGVELSKIPEEAKKKANLENAKRGQEIQIEQQERVEDVDQQLVDEMANDMINRLFNI